MYPDGGYETFQTTNMENDIVAIAIPRKIRRSEGEKLERKSQRGAVYATAAQMLTVAAVRATYIISTIFQV
jgi:hypothetical protein